MSLARDERESHGRRLTFSLVPDTITKMRAVLARAVLLSYFVLVSLVNGRGAWRMVVCQYRGYGYSSAT